MFSRISLLSPHFFITLSLVLHAGAFWLAVDVLCAAERVESDPAGRFPQAAAPGRDAADFSTTGSRNVTGISPAGHETESAGPLADLPKTSLGLVLIGIVNGEGRDSRAIILSKESRTQQLYQVGDTVAGAQIRSIRWGMVVLGVGGRDEVLDMSEASGYRRKETAAPVPHTFSQPLPDPSQKKNVASAEEGADSSLIPERVRLVLPGQRE